MSRKRCDLDETLPADDRVTEMNEVSLQCESQVCFKGGRLDVRCRCYGRLSLWLAGTRHRTIH
jgi:hypothetical protein